MKGFPIKGEPFFLTDLKLNYESTKHFGDHWQHATRSY